jgi:adenylate kinase
MMIILFIGAQASGKGTQAKIIAEKKGFAHISTGDLLRDAKGELKKLADSAISQGNLVPSDIIINLLKKRMKQPDCKKGIILDGFPRNLAQAEDLETIGKVDKIFEIEISDETAKKRLMGRWNCSKCKTAYNIITAPKPKQDKICDNCQIPLFQRDDDKDEKAIEKRLAIYHEETEPILKRYKDKVVKVDGEKTIEEITKDILKRL